MISYEEACSIILDQVQPLAKVRVKLEKLLGAVLGEPVLASHDLPLFDNSAVDGYGVYLSDVREASETNPVTLKLRGEIRAGDAAAGDTLPAASACKVYTGAVVPLGVDAVVMREHCEEADGCVSIKHAPTAGENIRRRGGEFLRGQQILPEGIRITPPLVGLLAALGQASFMVHKKPTVAIVSTGNELVKPGKSLSPGKIYDSNSYSIRAALEALGIEDFLPLHCREDLAETRKVLRLALDFADIVITAGGVSVGDHDYVKQVFEELGVKTHVYKVAMKPGKPVYFGSAVRQKSGRKQYVFGLPGNPVSVLVTFNQLVKPAIHKIAGRDDARPEKPLTQLMAKLACEIKKTVGRLDFVRASVFLENGELIVKPTDGQDSHMLGGLSRANCLIVCPAEKERLASGESVLVELMSWSV